ncbi:hypothetical protein [Paenibacillus sp. CGMCC 1.18879]|uniref:AlkZ-related protein n=3 Tax=Paenibacillus TaxID=44249 RepID=UPI001CA885F3|nr:hypothetical protein [Paenibacillus sp. CGMCC 1.18879]MBY9078440.1 hypothetical protein [Paenibacillus sp. CGMCC 1.18879]
MHNSSRTDFLSFEFQRYGLLLLNEDPKLPSVVGVGGDWQSLMSLIESRSVFYSKIYKNRVTYLSKELYFHLKPFRQRKNLTEIEGGICDFLNEVGEAEKDEIVSALMLGKDSYNLSMDSLFKSLYVTAIRRGRTINQQWSTLFWGTSDRWESDLSEEHKYYSAEESAHFIFEKLKSTFSEKQIYQFMNS